MRPDPGKPIKVPNVRGQAPDKMIRQVRRYELITPLFGGGVLPQQADPITTVRGSEIRGQLRFWWRACRGAEYGSGLPSLKQAEDELWGAGGGKDGPKESQVKIAVAIVNRGQPFEVKDREGNPISIAHFRSPYSYAAFPLQQNRNAVTITGIVFDLEIIYPIGRQQDVEAALWAWQTFGGIGGRTRRGFGALCCTQIDGKPVPLPASGSLKALLRSQLEHHVSDKLSPPNLPHLTPKSHFQLTARYADRLKVWQQLIQKLRDFRQARNKGGRGISYWPEPDEIRRRFPNLIPVHPPSNSVGKFPRASFGLPIIFHFKDYRPGNQRSDPPDTTLQGTSAGRLASPLILRTIQCNDGVVGLGLILEGSRALLKDLKLHSAGRDKPILTQLSPGEATSMSTSTPALEELKGQPDVLLAFLKTLI